MQASRRLQAGAWASFKAKFKSRFMIGDTHEHYIPPRPEFLNRASKYDAEDEHQYQYRVPAPASQPVPHIPRGYPETEYDISLAKRPSLKLTPSTQPGRSITAEEAALEAAPMESGDLKFDPAHVPTPRWQKRVSELKKMRRVFLATGVWPHGVSNYGNHEPYRPTIRYRTREEWEQVPLIRDIRVPRI